MKNVNQIRIISIWVFIVTFVSLNLCLFISINGHLLQGTIFQVDPMGRSAFTIPYIDGSVSISRTARTFPAYLIFKPGMLITAILLIKYWRANNKLIQTINNDFSKNNYFLFFGVASAVWLIIQSLLVGIKFDGDLLINGFIGYKNKIIHNKYGTKCLLGPKYQIISRKQTKKNYQHRKKIDLIATFGGFDSSNIIPVLIDSLDHNSKKINTKIILGPSTKKNKKLIQQKEQHISVIQKTPDLMKEISKAKFGFCGGGITSYEFAHMKVPFAIISQYPHQLIVSKEWQKLGIGLNLGLLNKSTPRKIQHIVNNFNKIRNDLKTNQNVVDGLGSRRIAKEIHKLLNH